MLGRSAPDLVPTGEEARGVGVKVAKRLERVVGNAAVGIQPVVACQTEPDQHELSRSHATETIKQLARFSICGLPDEKGNRKKTQARSNDFQTHLNEFYMRLNAF